MSDILKGPVVIENKTVWLVDVGLVMRACGSVCTRCTFVSYIDKAQQHCRIMKEFGCNRGIYIDDLELLKVWEVERAMGLEDA